MFQGAACMLAEELSGVEWDRAAELRVLKPLMHSRFP